MQTWRFIPATEASGLHHMAVDEWLLEQHRLGKGLPCLRFYTWNPTAISLGYNQYEYPKYWHKLSWNNKGIDLVRRPSGGRAVLHQGDLTYALIVSGFSGRRRDIYKHICQFLIEGWRTLGIELHLGADKDKYQRSANCFGSATAADLVMNDGYKVIGSAQLYRDGCILQHGSMQLRPDPALTKIVFGTHLKPPVELSNIVQQDVIAALLTSMERIFEVKLNHHPLTQDEQIQALELAKARTLTKNTTP